ncbi:transcriptional regulator of molybdate metabolism, LysR family [Pseudoduganella lurida]|uniref:Transcriptional regulator of molybdate metabolism, LysR family n=1 Tax=Pseudoduganella lurida TaxID=1036180 RepID=A0A562QWN4_9BURK|nr:substrate-binding domain-containing protein [Pseudoduganella lurida]TWI61195.1 transcriptional regulator of molybdate metabolism, LysR family [Pseudoduganella lurida]
MLKVEIRPDWILRDARGNPTALPALLALLTAVSETGSISKAAAAYGMSYRHAWGLLQQFSEQFGAALVHKVRGQGTALSPLAEKLIWADRRISARLTPLLDSLASELQQELARVLAGDAQVLRLTASHGFAVAALVTQLREGGATVDIKYRSSTEAVAALARGECDLAGFHLPVGAFEGAAAAQHRPWLDNQRHAFLHLAFRQQGLFIAKGNPKGVTGLDDLLRPDLRFVNRQHGSGTRLLLELLLADRAIDTARIAGFDSAEFTHAAVAAYVASGMADLSFGVETAARRFDLDFLPVCRERYFLACDRNALDTPLLQAARTAMASTAFRQVLDGLPGYDGAQAGTLAVLDTLF